MRSGYHLNIVISDLSESEPLCRRGPSRPPGKIYMTRVYPADREKKMSYFCERISSFGRSHIFHLSTAVCQCVLTLQFGTDGPLCKMHLVELPK